MTGAIRTIVAVLAAAAALYAMQRTTPVYSEITSPVRTNGQQGKRVETRNFAIGIAKVHLARSIDAPKSGRPHSYTTSGVWVIVEAAVQATNESLSLTAAEWLGPDGTRYSMSQRLSTLPGTPGTEQLEPGVPRPMLMIFEVPESQLSGATLLVSQSAYTPLSEEAAVAMTEVQTDDIRPVITIKRGGGTLPWVLEAE
ncbi:MAG TPA: hypothetical protein VMF90_15185 [Rhizobiaceae bacterium]|nr:hypothetical protein [Rhizobiaceae bacterium]